MCKCVSACMYMGLYMHVCMCVFICYCVRERVTLGAWLDHNVYIYI